MHDSFFTGDRLITCFVPYQLPPFGGHKPAFYHYEACMYTNVTIGTDICQVVFPVGVLYVAAADVVFLQGNLLTADVASI
jgi:hypothetical protein